jgi:hypothetical protein
LAALRGVAFERAELLAYVASMWSSVEDDPDAGRWAGEFLEARTALRRGGIGQQVRTTPRVSVRCLHSRG